VGTLTGTQTSENMGSVTLTVKKNFLKLFGPLDRVVKNRLCREEKTTKKL